MTLDKHDSLAPGDSRTARTTPSSVSRRAALLTVGTVALVALSLWFAIADHSPPDSALETHTVGRGDVVVTSAHLGTVTSVQTTDFLCEVEAVTYQDYRAEGAEVLWIVPDGTTVKRGDVLVELNDTILKELRDDWQLKVVDTEGEYKQADIGYENQLTKRETELADALSQLESAESLKLASEGMREIELAQIAEEARMGAEGVKMQQLLLEIAEAMDRIGAAGSTTATPQEARYNYQFELMKLGQALGDLQIAKHFEHPLEAEEMQAAVKSAQRALVQSQRDCEAVLQRLATRRDAAAKMLNVQRERLQHFQEQIDKCAIHAPHDGVVMYTAHSDENVIVPGAILRARQPILTLHGLSPLQLEVLLPATAIDQVRTGLPATVEFDTGDGRRYQGQVAAVRQSGDYFCAFITPDDASSLRLGATATVSIQIKRLPDVICIPRTSYISRGGRIVGYVKSQRGWQQRVLKLGAVGEEYAEVLDGLKAGETIALDAALAGSTAEVD